MPSKKSLLTLVLGAYTSSCYSLAELKVRANEKTRSVGLVSLASITTPIIETAYLTQVCILRNILMEAEISPDELVEVEASLRTIETRHKDSEKVLESVRMIRAKIQQVGPTAFIREGQEAPCVDIDWLADQVEHPD